MIDRVTTLDPQFVLPYIYGGVYMLMETGSVNRALHLLEKGRRHNPGRWEFPLYLGWISWMYRGNAEAARLYLAEAVRKPDCPAYVFQMLSGLSTRLGKQEMTRIYFEGLLHSLDNPEIRARVLEMLYELETQSQGIR
mgnify:CR=1 FL=1